MKFVDILKTSANVAAGIFLGQPIFPHSEATPMLGNSTSAKIIEAVASIERITTEVAALKTLSGPDKLAAAAAIARDSIIASFPLTGAKVVDQERFNLGVSKITDGWNDIAKSVEKK